jgi:hypothetical protein
METTASLKGYTPALARILSTTSIALYERQRALVRAGLLGLGRRGPGGGVRVGSDLKSVALLLVATLATDSLSEVEARAPIIAGLVPSGADRCRLTSMPTFLDALASILTSRARAARIVEITVSRTADRAVIVYKNGRSEFGDAKSEEPPLRASATLSGAAVVTIANDVAAMLNVKFERQERVLAVAANPTKRNAS